MTIAVFGSVKAEQYMSASFETLQLGGRQLKEERIKFQFYEGADGYTVQEELTKTQIVGNVIGFTLLGAFIAYGIILITMDVY